MNRGWRFLSILTVLVLLLCASFPARSEGRVINELNMKSGEEHYTFPEDAELLEIYLPSILGSDCAILRMGDETMMIDASYDSHCRLGVVPALEALGLSHIQNAFVSHPHDDHMKGFWNLVDMGYTFDRLSISFSENWNWFSANTVRAMKSIGAEIVMMEDGEEFDFGKAHVRFLKRQRSDFTENNLSGMLHITYGNCTYFSPGDIENRAQEVLMQTLPDWSLQSDILKYPHHGYAPINADLLEILDPELVIINGQMSGTQDSIAQMNRRNIPWTRQYPEAIEMLTDGNVWVVRHPAWGSR
ncbi:MAG: hypothetical protein IJ083_09600 [Clostridia bacterium]|nr:hypothetical protein [Clostridia bacterium]